MADKEEQKPEPSRPRTVTDETSYEVRGTVTEPSTSTQTKSES
ncbi:MULTISPECIES: hypothetical protein [Flavobacterium]|jgi:hypothetical protein|nr:MULTISPECIES: hypothetical protein [Flavobacterium]MDI5897624.1 hypothetical protein [Flavobacterium yafengii]